MPSWIGNQPHVSVAVANIVFPSASMPSWIGNQPHGGRRNIFPSECFRCGSRGVRCTSLILGVPGSVACESGCCKVILMRVLWQNVCLRAVVVFVASLNSSTFHCHSGPSKWYRPSHQRTTLPPAAIWLVIGPTDRHTLKMAMPSQADQALSW